MITDYFEDVEVWRATKTTDSYGNTVYGPYALYETIQGRIDKESGQEEYLSQKDTERTTHVLYTESSEATISDKIKFDGDLYEVLYSDNVMNYGRLYQVLLELIK